MIDKSTFTELIFDTLIGNKNYPQFDRDKVKDQFVIRGNDSKGGDKGEMYILYGRVAYQISVKRLEGYHKDLTTI